MSALTIQVSPEQERQLRREAAARGMDLDSYLALRLAPAADHLAEALRLLAEAGELLGSPASEVQTERVGALLRAAGSLLRSAWTNTGPSEHLEIAADTPGGRSLPTGGAPDRGVSSGSRRARDPWRGLPRRRPEDLDELARAQGAPLAVRYEDLKAGFWPEDESSEEFAATVRTWRREGSSQGS